MAKYEDDLGHAERRVDGRAECYQWSVPVELDGRGSCACQCQETGRHATLEDRPSKAVDEARNVDAEETDRNVGEGVKDGEFGFGQPVTQGLDLGDGRRNGSDKRVSARTVDGSKDSLTGLYRRVSRSGGIGGSVEDGGGGDCGDKISIMVMLSVNKAKKRTVLDGARRVDGVGGSADHGSGSNCSDPISIGLPSGRERSVLYSAAVVTVMVGRARGTSCTWRVTLRTWITGRGASIEGTLQTWRTRPQGVPNKPS